MKFTRNARILKGQLDMAPFAAVFFLLVILMLVVSLLYTPGVRIQLPVADDLPGLTKPTVKVAMDASGRLYFENQTIGENELKAKLHEAVAASTEPLALVVLADKAVSYDMILHLSLLARDAGISEALMATLPRSIGSSGQPVP